MTPRAAERAPAAAQTDQVHDLGTITVDIIEALITAPIHDLIS
ncbi:hypothetical protein VIMS_01305 [Mycobacterium marinum]|nr:hypothetical protein [Mycobacterium marinum]RFZ18988.1 hypothetical protein VIMS_01305 [Mycobacterium marinum]